MRSREPVPDRRDGGDRPEREPPGQHPGSEHDLWSGPSLTIAEAARTGGGAGGVVAARADPPLSRRRALPRRPPAAKPHPRSAWALANPDPGPGRSPATVRPGPHTRPGTEEPALERPNGQRARG